MPFALGWYRNWLALRDSAGAETKYDCAAAISLCFKHPTIPVCFNEDGLYEVRAFNVVGRLHPGNIQQDLSGTPRNQGTAGIALRVVGPLLKI